MIINPSLRSTIHQYADVLSENQHNADDLNRSFYKKARFVDGLPATKAQPSLYQGNPYFRLLNGLRGRIEDCELKEGFYHKGELFLFNETYGDPGSQYREVNPLGYFVEGFSYPKLDEQGATWMSLIPHEINTMAPSIGKAVGKVLTMGLGLGYYAFMASEKTGVESVDVIENDPKVIALFTKHLLPLFPHPEKIKIIPTDAIEFARLPPHDYDYAFVDLYRTEEDGLPLYLALKPLEINLVKPSGTVSFWIERTLTASLRRYLIALLDEEMGGTTDRDYRANEDFSDLIFAKIHFLLKQKRLETPDDVQSLLGDESLIGIASKLLR